MSLILILGKGDLAEKVHKMLPGSCMVGRPEFDLSNKSHCDSLINQFDPTTVINTVAVNEHHDTWNILQTNYVSQVYLTMRWLEKNNPVHIINISSASSYWASWPNINEGRLVYNISKESLSQFGKHVNRMIVDQNTHTVSTIELGSFASKFNNYTGGMTLQRAADLVVECVRNPVTAVSCIK